MTWMHERCADRLAEIERQIEAALADAVTTLELMVETIEDPSPPAIDAIGAAAVRLRSASRESDAALVIVSAREAPVAEDRRLVMTLIQLAQHQALIAAQFELIGEQLASIPTGIADRQGTGPQLARMVALAAAQLRCAVDAFASRALLAAYQVETDDDAIDHLNLEIFTSTLDTDRPLRSASSPTATC